MSLTRIEVMNGNREGAEGKFARDPGLDFRRRGPLHYGTAGNHYYCRCYGRAGDVVSLRWSRRNKASAVAAQTP